MKSTMSVVIPVYNRADSLQCAVASVLSQTVGVDEIIIIDDCSTVELSELVTDIGDSRIRYYKLKRNRGAGYARNVGVRLATSDLIAFLDSDDVWYPHKLEQQLQEMDASGADVVYCSVDTETHSGSSVMPALHSEDILDALLQTGNVVVGGFSSVLVRRKAYCSVGGIRASLRARQDYELHLRLSMAGFNYSYSKQPGLFFKTIGENRITSNHYSRILGLLEVYQLLKDKYIERGSQHGIDNLYEVQMHLLCLHKRGFAKVLYCRMLKSALQLRTLNMSLIKVLLKGLIVFFLPAKSIQT